ncbi:MAG: hypothetical protein IKJ36_02600 [Clostridia bacterium]|nr:hypothetical protein [Clostridia bacterium]
MEEKVNNKEKNSKKILVLIGIIIIALVLIWVFIPSNVSKEVVLETAQELEINEFNKEINNNIERAKELYVGNAYYYTDYVDNISGTTVKLGNFEISLNKDDIKKITKGQMIKIVGKIKKIEMKEIQKTSFMGSSYTENEIRVKMENVYLVDDTYTITGKVNIADKYLVLASNFKKVTRDNDDWYCYIEFLGNEVHLIEEIEEKNRNFVEEGATIINGVEIKDGDNITIKCKLINNNINPISNNLYARDKVVALDIETIKINEN